MAWENTSVEDQRLKFVNDYLSDTYSITGLCRFYGISRPTAYKWIERYLKNGTEGLKNLSRTPLNIEMLSLRVFVFNLVEVLKEVYF